jgi:hypothetical protein
LLLDVHHHTKRRGMHLVVLLQHHFLDGLETRVVALLQPIREAPMPLLEDLHIRVDFDGSEHVVRVDQLATLRARELGPRLGSLEPWRYEVRRALDRLWDGL